MSKLEQHQAPEANQRSSPGLIICPLRPQDIDAVAAMQDLPGVRWGTMRLPHPSPAQARNWIERTLPGGASLIATIGGQVVGCVTLERLQGWRALAGRISMGVHDAWTRQGIGTALLRAIIDVAERLLGLRRLELMVYADNAPALALYRRHGFSQEGQHSAGALRESQDADILILIRRT